MLDGREDFAVVLQPFDGAEDVRDGFADVVIDCGVNLAEFRDDFLYLCDEPVVVQAVLYAQDRGLDFVQGRLGVGETGVECAIDEV